MLEVSLPNPQLIASSCPDFTSCALAYRILTRSSCEGGFLSGVTTTSCCGCICESAVVFIARADCGDLRRKSALVCVILRKFTQFYASAVDLLVNLPVTTSFSMTT